jgi:dipeptidyl aminopeptidase/acylaminoacyl peptidase
MVVGLGALLSSCASVYSPVCPTSSAPRPATVSDQQTPAKAADERVVVLQGTPEIPDEVRERLRRYLNTRSASLASLSDRGDSMIIRTRFGETSQVHFVDRPMGARVQLTFNDEPIRLAKLTPGRADQMLLLADIGGNEQFQIFHVDRNAGASTLLTDGRSRHGGFLFNDSGTQIVFSSNARNGKDMDLYLSDGRTPNGAKLWLTRDGHWYPMDWSSDGNRVLVGEYISINDARVHLAEVGSTTVSRLSPESPVASYRDAQFSKDGKRVYVTSDREGELVELYEHDLATKSWTSRTRDIRWNVEQMAVSPDGRTVAFTANEDGYSVLYTMDRTTGRVRRQSDVPAGLIGDLQYAPKANVLGFTLSGPKATGDAYTYDVRLRKLTRWTASEMGGLNPDGFSEPELVHYETFDGRKIPAYYYKPKGEGPFPVMVNIHGGPEAQARPYFSPVTQYLVNESKIAVLVPNVRGSDGYGKTYLQLDNGFKREDSVKDIGSLLDWIGKRPELDAKRVGVFGGSYGGYMVLASLIHFGDRIRAGCDVVGISNFVTFLTNTKEYRRDLRRAEYGDERDDKMRAFLQSISPTTHLSKIRSPLFVAHGANDPRVPVSETDQIVDAVKNNGQDVWYMLARNEGHGFRKKENRDTFSELMILFFEKHLKGDR